ncbi:MAG: DUF2703 domain-containing protein [Erysipelotrichaceae bacterium]|nr:DUF2703 domain-containing protein [Erysipelotrichaceae bacterium]
MAKKWYPVVDILSCVECGTCVNFCSHGVYDKKKSPAPVVIHPEYCVDHCHGCGIKCPVGAITYVGDDTGWVPFAASKNSEVELSCGCCSDIAGSNIDCRVFEYEGIIYEVPTKEILTDTEPIDVAYVMPENLKHFYEGKNRNSSCNCGCK